MRYKLDLLFKFFCFSLLFFVLSKASIYADIYPFAFPMLFALAWANQKVWILAPAYVIGQIASFPNFQTTISSIVCVTFLLVPYFVHLLIKKNMRKWELFVYAILSQLANVVFVVIYNGNLVYLACEILIGLVFLYLAITIFEPIIIRGFIYKLSSWQLICGGSVLMAIADGLISCDVYGFSVLKLVVSFLILSVCYISNVGYTLGFASIMAIGTMLPSLNPIYVTPFVLWGLTVCAFRFQNKIYPALSIVGVEALCIYFFKLYYAINYMQILPVVISAFLFAIIPNKYFRNIQSIFPSNTSRLAIKNVVNRNRDVLQRRLKNLGEVFFEMNNVFKKLIKRQMSTQEIKEMLYKEVRNTICKNCPENGHCHRTFYQDTKNIFEELVMVAYERGKATILDFPSYLSSRCGKVSQLLNEINTLTNQYKSYSELVGNVDTSKLLISDQLEGISDIMKKLSEEVNQLVSFDTTRENRLINELSANNVICTDAVIYERDSRTTMASLVVRDEDANKLKVQQIASKICGGKMSIYEILPTERPGLMNVNLKSSPRFDCIFGLSQHTKSGNNISGDCHSITRLDGDKFMFAICDGMGSGEQAGEKSETSISLIENFYKAGFDNEIILSSVNKLLNLEKGDIFSTLDICVVDLKNGIADFVKMGASSSFIRGCDGCEVIESGALPIGVLDDAKPLTRKIVLSEKDFIILCSDGVSDSFASDGQFKDFLLTIKSANPQEFADEIIQKSLSNNSGYAVDDMTCLVVKIF